MAGLKPPPIIRGADWGFQLQWQIEDASGNGVAQDLTGYALDCDFKTEPGTDKRTTVKPTLSLPANDWLQVSLDEKQTQNLEVGVLFFNVLATKSGITEQIVSGSIDVSAGVTTS